jgi:2,4-dienoyl-CoA reductase [(3E)-enoyl-CoA-producing], peroxisomal
MAKDIATARPGSKVIGFGAVDVRSYDSLKDAVDRCVKELGGIDFVMYVKFPPPPSLLSLIFFIYF